MPALNLQVTNMTAGQKVAIETSSLPGGAIAAVVSAVNLIGSQYTSINVTTGSFAAGVFTGAEQVYILSTNAVPGAQLVRSAAQMLADTPNGAAGMTWRVRIINSGAGTLTLAADAGATVTINGTATVPTNTFRDFMCTMNTATTATVQSVGSGSI